MLLATALGLSGCHPADDRLWPSTRPSSPGPGSALSAERPFLSLLPENAWELAGGLGLLAVAGGIGFLYGKSPDLREELSRLRDLGDRLHERRDRSTADLAMLSRRVNEIESELLLLKREFMRRPLHPQAAPRVAFPRPQFPDDPSAAVDAAAARMAVDRAFGGDIPGEPSASPDALAPPTPAALAAPMARAAATGAPPEPSPWSDAALEAPEPTAPADGSGGPGPAGWEAPEPAEAPAREEPELPAAGPESWQPAPLPTLEALVEAINGRGSSPIQGVTCVELEVAQPPEEESGRLMPLATRLRMVGSGGRFLLVMVEGDAWLFPTIETLEGFIDSQPEEGLFHYLPDSTARPQLIRPSLLREVGGLWEVSDLGEILVPTT